MPFIPITTPTLMSAHCHIHSYTLSSAETMKTPTGTLLYSLIFTIN